MRLSVSTTAQVGRAALETAVESGEIVGAVALVARHGHAEVVSVGQRSREHNEPMQRDTLFRVSSMTKPVTAAATLILAEDGMLQLDEPIDTLLPELADRSVLRRLNRPLDDTVPADRPITARMLLDFTWGFGLVLEPPSEVPLIRRANELKLGMGLPDPTEQPNSDEWLRRLGELPLAAQPGQQWLYNTGSDVLGVLVARASGQSLATFLSERVFEPLGMSDTGFYVPRRDLARLASMYRMNAAGELELRDDANLSRWSEPPLFPSGAAGLVSSVDDYFSFAQMLLAGGSSGRRRVLFAQSVSALTSDQLTHQQRSSAGGILATERSWGYGLSVPAQGNRERPDNDWYGWDGGLGTSWRNYPELGLVGVLLTQSEWRSPRPPRLVGDFWRAATAH